jgi:16S rRNA (cytosine1402-N4)-methyltransferase
MQDLLTHKPVLLDEALAALALRGDGLYVDGTFGRGGHSGEILSRLGDQGRLLAFDRDPQAVATARERFGDDPRFDLHYGNFSELNDVLEQRGLLGRVDGLLLDLGVSSPQLDDAERGFSFSADGPLDMRMDCGSGQTAAEWLARASEEEIADVLWRYGDERFSRRIARAVVERRTAHPLRRTSDLVALIESASPRRERHKHPATRSFQAIRIHINQELAAVESVLQQSLSALAPGGRLAVISFHSLEDRIVKHFIRGHSRPPPAPRGLPPDPNWRQQLNAVGKAIRASDAETRDNPRARSAVLRVAERIA